MIPINSLLKERSSNTVWRILAELASRETKDTATTHYVLIDVHASGALPFFEGKLRIHARIADDEIAVIDEVYEPVNLRSLTAYDKLLVDRRWKLVEFTQRFGDKIWDPKFRGRMARLLAAFRIFSKPFLYITLRQYWQRGLMKEAVSTDMWRCGAPGTPRVPAEGSPKTGRPRSIQPGVGIATTEEHRRNMRLAWASAPVGRDGRGLRHAWHWLLITRYAEHITVVPQKDESQRVKVNNYDAVPTFEQFEHLWTSEHPFEVRQLKRMQQRRFDLAFKPLLSGTLPEVRGPGTRYYIDATVLDVYAVSRMNRRRILCRPTLYCVVDQFSRMIVGVYVGLEPPCWVGALLALYNCSVDKVRYCKHYGIDIRPDQWPTAHMPLHLMGDRGELKMHEANKLATGFQFDVENARAYTGEAKGVVERVFLTLQADFGPYLPGYIDKELAGRDAEPAVLRSAMTVDAITRSVLNSVLIANSRVVRDYDGWPEVIAAGTPFVPVSLWAWGVENLRSDVRKFSDVHLRRYLWPEAQMLTKRRGLHLFRGLYYMGEQLLLQSWFAQALHRKELVNVVYHPHETGSALALPSGAQGGCCEVSLTRRSQRFGGVTFSELSALDLQKKRQNASAAWTNLPDWLAAHARIIGDATYGRKTAERLKPPGETRAERTRDLRQNRDAEIDLQTMEAITHTAAVDLPAVPALPTNPQPNLVADDAAARTADEVRRLMQARRSNPPIDTE